MDSADERRLNICKEELHKLLAYEKLAGATLLIFANKQVGLNRVLYVYIIRIYTSPLLLQQLPETNYNTYLYIYLRITKKLLERQDGDIYIYIYIY